MLLSATVSPHDINAICNKIGINDANLCVVWGSNIRRQEIFYTIQQKKSTFINDIIHIISSSNDWFIIYGPTYHSCDEVYGVIQGKLPNIKVRKYHGDVQSDKQEEVLINFKKGILQGVIATPGFGMGINIIDIHKVIHLAFPLSIGINFIVHEKLNVSFLKVIEKNFLLTIN
jgi:superfamily II DNA helicase RecQ